MGEAVPGSLVFGQEFVTHPLTAAGRDGSARMQAAVEAATGMNPPIGAAGKPPRSAFLFEDHQIVTLLATLKVG